MKSGNMAEIKAHFGRWMATVQEGEEVQICKRNVPIGRIIPIKGSPKKNQTQLGCGHGTVTIKGNLTDPAFSENDWEMLK